MDERTAGLESISFINTVRRGPRLVFSNIVAFWLRLRGVEVGQGCVFYGFPRVTMSKSSRIVLGDRVVIRSGGVSNPLSQGLPCVLRTVLPGATLIVGARTGISSAVISCWERIELGQDTLVGAGTVITDSDAHVICSQCRTRDGARMPATAPVEVGAGSFLGAHSAILKGVRIGEGCVVGFGSVVTSGSYPGGSLLVGLPAVVKQQVRCAIHQPADDQVHGMRHA